jgi:hypothetical protein
LLIAESKAKEYARQRWQLYPTRTLLSAVRKGFPACSAKSFAVLLEALLDGAIAICQLRSAKSRGVARAGVALLRRALLGLRSCVARTSAEIAIKTILLIHSSRDTVCIPGAR